MSNEKIRKNSKEYSRIFSFSRWIFIAIIVIFISTISLADARMLEYGLDTTPSDYSESALRRFEVVSIISLPFTAIHSYLVFRGARMIEQSKFSPDISNTDYTIIGGMAVTFSAFIGFWDWYHNRGRDTSQPKIPEKDLQRKKQTKELSLNSDFINSNEDLFVVQLYQIEF